MAHSAVIRWGIAAMFVRVEFLRRTRSSASSVCPPSPPSTEYSLSFCRSDRGHERKATGLLFLDCIWHELGPSRISKHFFPLTPALSLGARKPHSPACEKAKALGLSNR